MEVAAVLAAVPVSTVLKVPLHALNVLLPIIVPALQLSSNAPTIHIAQLDQYLLLHAEIITNALVPQKRHAQRVRIVLVLTQLIPAYHAQLDQNAQIKEDQDSRHVQMENGVLQDPKSVKLAVKVNHVLIKLSHQ